MKFPRCIINNFGAKLLLPLAVGFFAASQVNGQRIAFLAPEAGAQAVRDRLESYLAGKFTLVDDSLSETVLKASDLQTPFNLTTEESQDFSGALGCDFFIILRSQNFRRAALAKKEYFESSEAVYLVSARTGRLLFWTLKSFEAESPVEADSKLLVWQELIAGELSEKISRAYQDELNAKPRPELEELPPEDSPEAKNFRSPLPFKRLRPAYPAIANLYGIAATIDALVDLDEKGAITNIEIARWAGYGLEESVIKTIREMQWRPASRAGKSLPIRVLLRYNFKKLETQ